jgi:hypothetical protein
VCDSAGYFARSKRVAYSYLVLCCYGGSVELCSTEFSFSLLGMIHACSFYSPKEVQGYMMLAYGVTLSVEEPGGLGRALSGTAATCSGTCAIAKGVVSVFRHCCDVLCHTWNCSRRGIFVLVV